MSGRAPAAITSPFGRRPFLTMLGGAGALLTGARFVAAQPRTPARKVGWLVVAPPTDRRAQAFRDALAELGWIEGRDFTVEWRPSHARLELVEQAARELLAANVDLILTSNTAYTLAALRATRSIPIVMLSSGFPVEAGAAQSLRFPGGNVTGNTIYAGGEVFAKIVGFLRDLRPGLRTLAVLWDYVPPAFPEREVAVASDELMAAGRAHGLRVSMEQLQAPGDVQRALTALASLRPDAVFVTSGPVVYVERARIAKFLQDRRLPSASDFGLPEYWQDRLLIYSPDTIDLARQSARYVDQIFRGAKPGDLPIQLPSRFELTINLKMARAFGIGVPPTLLARADRTLE